jgi:tetratricopeptide (TPR) repeat protein
MVRRLLQPSTLVPALIIAGVTAIVGYANWRDAHRPRLAPVAAMPPASGTSRADLDRRVSDAERRLKRQPDDVAAAMLLADALLRQTRVTGNVGLSMRAELVLRHALEADPGNYDVNRMLATVYLSQHRFRDAIAAAERNRRARPYDPVNDGVIGDGHLELGEYDQAFDAFDRMMARRPGAPSYARVAYARELQGDLPGARHAMALAADATAPQDREGLAWALAQVGELDFQMGRLHDAKLQFARASQAFPGHPFAVLGYAKTIAAEGDLPGALTLLQDLQRRSPTPDLAARIGDLLERLGRHDEAERQYALAEAGWHVDVPDPKNLSRFLSDRGRHLDEALRQAEQAVAVRHDIFSMDALAWARFRTGDLTGAAAASNEARRTGTRDREILYHAAAIAHARGDDRDARRLIDRALDGNHRFDLVLAPAALKLRAEIEPVRMASR